MLKESATINHPSPKGISFWEEEIEEHGGSLDSQFLDLMQHVKPTHTNKPQSSPLKKEPGENMDFDFEKACLTYILIDIIAQINLDDFLDWEGDFSKEVKSEERIDSSDFGVFPEEELEELEEGEIPAC